MGMTHVNAKRTRRDLILGTLAILLLILVYRVFAVYTVRSGECRPKPIDPNRRLFTRDEHGTIVSFPERIGFPVQTRPLVVMTYNISGHSALLHGDHIRQIAEVINTAKPDIVGLQEVHRKTWQSRYRDQLAELEQLTGMHGYFCKSYVQGKGEFGNALLTRGEMVALINHPLPSFGEPRVLLESAARIDGATFSIYVTHLTTWGAINRASRREQLKCLALHVARSSLPYLLLGDLNAPPTAPELHDFMALHPGQLVGEDIPISHPLMHERIDYIFADYGWQVVSAHAIKGGPSDHYAVVATLLWGRS
jgi:endonuclease/exonuclease/phosphatase family metal-dependent hydrolase